MLDNTPNQPSKLKIKYWIEINNDTRGRYNTNSQIKFKTSRLKSIVFILELNVFVLVSGTITISGAEANNAVKRADVRNKGIIFKNYAPFTGYISEINNAQIDNAKDLDVVESMYNLIEYVNSYSKKSGDL